MGRREEGRSEWSTRTSAQGVDGPRCGVDPGGVEGGEKGPTPTDHAPTCARVQMQAQRRYVMIHVTTAEVTYECYVQPGHEYKKYEYDCI